MKWGLEKGNKYGGSDAKFSSETEKEVSTDAKFSSKSAKNCLPACVISEIEHDIGTHSSAPLQPSSPTKMTHKETQQGVGLVLPFAMWPWLISDWSVKIWIIMSTTLGYDN